MKAYARVKSGDAETYGGVKLRCKVDLPDGWYRIEVVCQTKDWDEERVAKALEPVVKEFEELFEGAPDYVREEAAGMLVELLRERHSRTREARDEVGGMWNITFGEVADLATEF